MEKFKAKECEKLVIYSVAFGDTYTEKFRPIQKKLVEQYHKFHNKCLFTFVLYDSQLNTRNLDMDQVYITTTHDGLDQRILVPTDVLPYENNRRLVF